jgi:hypothetical protein
LPSAAVAVSERDEESLGVEATETVRAAAPVEAEAAADEEDTEDFALGGDDDAADEVAEDV